jgi:predicted TIM-barrel fold metal-dependent hydrolase
MGENVLIVSADCHAGAPIQGYKEYLSKKWWDEFDDWAASFENPFADLDEIYADRNWDSTKRLRHLEEDGIAAEVIFPNTIPPFYPGHSLVSVPPSPADYDRRWAGLQAHNRWLVDFCNEVPGRRAGIAQLLFNKPEDAISEIKWARDSGLTGGVLMPALPPGSGLPPLWDGSYEPIWSACEDLGVPLNHHGGSGTPDYGFGMGMPRVMYLLEFGFFSNRVLTQLVWGGIFERHPNLRYVVTEQGFGSVLDGLRAQDLYYEMLTGDDPAHLASRQLVGDYATTLSLKPSEYVRRNVWFGASFMSAPEAARRHEAGDHRVMWGADYPHTEATWPHSRESIAAAVANVPRHEAEELLGLNAVELYGFDLALLRATADRVGPSRKELLATT